MPNEEVERLEDAKAVDEEEMEAVRSWSWSCAPATRRLATGADIDGKVVTAPALSSGSPVDVGFCAVTSKNGMC